MGCGKAIQHGSRPLILDSGACAPQFCKVLDSLLVYPFLESRVHYVFLRASNETRVYRVFSEPQSLRWLTFLHTVLAYPPQCLQSPHFSILCRNQSRKVQPSVAMCILITKLHFLCCTHTKMSTLGSSIRRLMRTGQSDTSFEVTPLAGKILCATLLIHLGDHLDDREREKKSNILCLLIRTGIWFLVWWLI